MEKVDKSKAIIFPRQQFEELNIRVQLENNYLLLKIALKLIKCN